MTQNSLSLGRNHAFLILFCPLWTLGTRGHQVWVNSCCDNQDQWAHAYGNTGTINTVVHVWVLIPTSTCALLPCHLHLSPTLILCDPWWLVLYYFGDLSQDMWPKCSDLSCVFCFTISLCYQLRDMIPGIDFFVMYNPPMMENSLTTQVIGLLF